MPICLGRLERFRVAFFAWVAIWLSFCTLSHSVASADPAAMMGCGNLYEAAGAKDAEKYAAINAAGVKLCRIPVYPYSYYWGAKRATPEKLDAAVLQAHSYGITPVMLFEYYTRFPTPLGDYDVWHQVGKAFAARFKPNSDWWLAQGIKDYGITVYSALNEPDIDKPVVRQQAYHDALKGLADGVHEAGPDLRIVTGGMAGPNSHSDYACAGLGPAIADLLNDGTLDGIDLHTYNGEWAPLAGHDHCAQHDFDAVKKAWGVTRDINFYCTEFNYQQYTGEVTKADIGDAAAANYFLTMIWDNLGVVGNSGTSVTKVAFCWNLFGAPDVESEYAMCTSLSPWVPNGRGSAYKLVAELTKGMSIAASDPNRSGTVILSSNSATMWVWQDRPHWSSFAGTACRLIGVPREATELRVYGWDGLRKTIPLNGAARVRVTGLAGDETYIFVANGRGHGMEAPNLVP